MKNKKVVVFDMDETLGYFTQFGVFCDCLDEYFNNPDYSINNFNNLLDLCPEFTRPKISYILNYLKDKKIEKKCYKVMIYTNNQGPKIWAEKIKAYFNNKIKYQLFDKIIAAFKINGKIVEFGRTSHDKTLDDFFRCTKLPLDVEICFIDDVHHYNMESDKVYYINVKPYHYSLDFSIFLSRFLDSNLGDNIKHKSKFIHDLSSIYKHFNFHHEEKDINEQDIDEIIGKKLFYHIKQFFYENTNKSIKHNKKNKKNKTLKRS